MKASFESRLVSRLSWWYNKPGDITKDFWGEAIQFHGTFHRLKITNRIACKKNWVLPDLNVKICCNNDQKNSKHCNKKKQTISLRFFRILNHLAILNQILYYAILRFCYFAVSFAFFWRPEFIKRSWCLSNICIICIRALHSSSIRSFKLTTRLELTDPERMSTISMSRKLDMSFKGNTVNRKVLFISALLKLGYQQECYFPDSAISNSKET